MRLTKPFLIALLALCLPAACPAAAQQGLFTPVATVNGKAVTQYEVDQRARMLTVLSGPGDHSDEALKSLIDDRVRLDAADQFGVTVSDAQIKQGEEEFASRANMTADQFLAQLGKAGVAPETFRDFVKAGQAWRSIVGGLIAPKINVTDMQAKASQAVTLDHAVPQVLLSELILPATPQYISQTRPLAEQLSKTIRNDADFSAAAQKYSVSQSAKDGGKLDWMPASNLPAAILDQVMKLSPGQVSAPISVPNAFVLFEMRGIRDAQAPSPASVKVEYMEYLIPGVGTPEVQQQVAALNAKVHECNDLYGIAKGQPAQVLTHETQALPQVPADVALQLAPLDPNEVSTGLTRGGNTVYLMLCSRIVTQDPPLTLEQQRDQLSNAKINDAANVYLAKLRADAIIRYK